jgi:hypothetical protein
MNLILLALVILPFIASIWAKNSRPQNYWAITGAAFGAVIHPFLVATTIPLMYGGALGNAILSITNQFTVLHRLPGRGIYFLINGHASREDFEFLVFAMNAVFWGVFYGCIGWYFDRSSKGE